ncbi:hypothetical protein L345_15761, partial [Ophiophagus hannah]
KIVSKIDGDQDGFVTVEELKAWIKFAQKRWIYEDVERQRKGHDLNGDGLISWEEYKNATYGYVLDTDKDGFVTEGELKDWIKKAQKKYVSENVARQWQEYDLNQDGSISWEEYRNVTYGTYLGMKERKKEGEEKEWEEKEEKVEWNNEREEGEERRKWRNEKEEKNEEEEEKEEEWDNEREGMKGRKKEGEEEEEKG